MLHLILSDKIGNHLQLNDFLPNFVPAETGEVWMSFINSPDKPAIFVAKVVAGQKLQIPITTEELVRFFLVSHDPTGKKTTVDLNMAEIKDYAANKETGTAAFSQTGVATNTQINFLATGYSTAKFRRVQYADDAGFTTNLVSFDQGSQNAALPAAFGITRATASGTKTVYVRIAHSTNNLIFGDWSDSKTATFANSGGTGGSGAGHPPNGLYGLRGGSTVSLYWTNTGGSSSNIIVVNGVPVYTASSTTDHYDYALPGLGYYSIYVENSDGQTEAYEFNYYDGFE